MRGRQEERRSSPLNPELAEDRRTCGENVLMKGRLVSQKSSSVGSFQFIDADDTEEKPLQIKPLASSHSKLSFQKVLKPLGQQDSPILPESPPEKKQKLFQQSPGKTFRAIKMPLFRIQTSNDSSRNSIESLQDNNGDDCRNDSKYDIDTVPDYERLLEENRQYMDFLESRKTIQSMEKVSLVPTSDEFCNRQVPRKVSIALKHPC